MCNAFQFKVWNCKKGKKCSYQIYHVIFEIFVEQNWSHGNKSIYNQYCLSCQFVAALSKSWYLNINIVIHQKNIMGINKCISMSLTTEHNKNYIECVLCQHLSWHILLVISIYRLRLWGVGHPVSKNRNSSPFIGTRNGIFSSINSEELVKSRK